MQRRNIDPTDKIEIGKRLKLSRAALGYTQAIMASKMGSSTAGQAWENYEAGRRRISLDHALALHRNLGLTLPWIYEGDLTSLPRHLREAIREHQQSGHSPTTLKVRRGGR